MKQPQTDKSDGSRNNMHIIISSQAAALVTNIAITPSEVVKIRQQKASLQKSLLNKQLNFNPSSLSSTFMYIVRNEGIKTFFNGLKYNLMRACGSNFTMFLTYEKIKQELLKSTSNFIIVPLLASSISQALSTTVTFPLEYWKTVQQSHTGKSKAEGFSLGNKLYSAYLVTVKKNVIFHFIYWTISENMRKKLGYYDSTSHYDTKDKSFSDIFYINAISGSIGSIFASFITAPLDIVKTRKQVFSDKYYGNNTYKMIADIIKNEGISQLYIGIRPSIISCMVYGSCMLSVYEGTYQFMQKINKQQEIEHIY